MTRVVNTPQSRCRAGLARCDITPPVGIYHRMWGAALHDRATGVHRPLTATALFCAPLAPRAEASPHRSEAVLVLSLDHCLLDRSEIEQIKAAASREGGLTPGQVQVCLTHTHAAGLMSRSRAELPGGELIGPYLDDVAAHCGRLATAAAAAAKPATMVYGTGRCDLAQNRDYWDEGSQRFVCGFNPDGPADDALLVARVIADDGQMLGSVVNYACHPTTLAWQNTLISPDYVGALREVVERETAAPCLFLQGASGDLGPRDGFVGDPAVADRNGRQVGFAALTVLESLPPPGTRQVYAGPVVSGATIGTWRHQPLSAEQLAQQHRWQSGGLSIDLAYRPELPTLDQTRTKLARWQAAEAAARAAGDEIRIRDARAHVERMSRQLARLAALPPGPCFPYDLNVLRLGDAVWLFLPGELYQGLQSTLRRRFPQLPLVIATIANDWQPGYIPAADAYGQGIYQDEIAAVASGSLERIIAAVGDEIQRYLSAQ
jgi:hypothetical protein